ncbi:MAG: VOC family protein [Lapillicoccus sp.]
MVGLAMKVLFPALRVRDLDASVVFYTSVGFEVVGQVDGADGTRMVMLALPAESDVSLELVHSVARDPVEPGGFDHLAVQVDDLEATRADLVSTGLDIGPVQYPGGREGPRTTSVFDPDGYHLELVQWPPGHPIGMARTDFEPPPST